MERLTCNELKIYDGCFVNMAKREESRKYSLLIESAPTYEEIYKKLTEYENLEEQGLLLRLDFKDELIEFLATKLLNSEFGNCYMCTNPMKNITLDGLNNGCDGQCNTSEDFTVDDFLKKIVSEIEYRKRKETEQALAEMQQSHAEAIMYERNGR